MFNAIDSGMPSSSIPMLGSPVITVRAEKSTLFPIKLPRILPSLPFNLWLIDLMGRPDLWLDRGIPGSVLSK